MAELWKISGLQLSRMIASKKVKPSEVMEAILTRIEEVNPKINAFCTLARDAAMAEARAADKKVTRAKSLGPLFGVPISVKDLIFISFIEDQEVIKKILKHLGLWAVKPRPPPRMTKAQPLCTEPHIDYYDSQVPPSDRARCNVNLILKEASCP